MTENRYPENCPQGKFPPVRDRIWVKVRISFRVGGNQTVAPKENCLPVRVRVKFRISFRVGGNQTIAPKENCLPVRVGVKFRISFGVGGNFPRG